MFDGLLCHNSHPVRASFGVTCSCLDASDGMCTTMSEKIQAIWVPNLSPLIPHPSLLIPILQLLSSEKFISSYFCPLVVVKYMHIFTSDLHRECSLYVFAVSFFYLRLMIHGRISGWDFKKLYLNLAGWRNWEKACLICPTHLQEVL